MIAGRRSKTVAFVAILALLTFGALATASAQPADIKAIGKAFQDHYTRGNYLAAQIKAQELERLVKARFGADHSNYAVALNRLGIVFQEQGKYIQAEELYKRALAINEEALGASHPDVGRILNNLASVYQAQGKYSEAEGLYKRALAIKEEAVGAIPSAVRFMKLWQAQGKYTEAEELLKTLNNLARVYQAQGKYSEAEELYKRALAIKEEILGAHPPVAAVDRILTLANVYQARRKYTEAEELLKTLNNLAKVYQVQGKYTEAEDLLKIALVIKRQVLGASHPDVGQTLSNLASVYQAQGKYTEAEDLLKRELLIRQQVLGASHPDVGQTLNLLALVYWAAPSLAREALEVAQWASQSSAAAAIQQMSARFGSGPRALASLARENQDLAANWRGQNKALLDALSNPEGGHERTRIDTLLRLAKTEARLNAVAARLDKEFPDYAAVAHPKPLTAEEVQKLLGANEALVFFLAGPNESYVFALTREGFEWRTISLGEKNMAAKVAAFRRGLDVEELRKSVDAGKSELFDLATAHEFYVALLGPVEALIKDKPQLLIVPSGPLTALPFHLLVTDKPGIAVPQMQIDDMAAYRDAAWVVKRHAVTVLPSVASLKALRVFARKGQGTKPMIGFGDPVFAPNQIAALGGRRTATVKIATRTRAYSDYWRGASVDRAKLAEALSPLPDSAEELKAVAAKLGASSSDIHLGRNATEANVKRLRLADYRVVYFATHGLVAGDVKGVGEPSLALTLPNEPDDLDDGLLTASEVAQLKLDADWVVLSACNTAAGEKPGAEALSGLARAFFYAGARALLVSHWRIDSKAATRLATSTFDIMKSNQTIGRAEALRRTMLAYLDDKSDIWNAYPGFWGSFSLIGEGAAR